MLREIEGLAIAEVTRGNKGLQTKGGCRIEGSRVSECVRG